MHFLYCIKEIAQILLKELPDEGLVMTMGLEKTLKKMEAEWDIMADYTSWIELLRNIFVENCNLGICNIADRNYMTSTKFRMIDRCLIYDKKYYFITSEMFKKACEQIPYIRELELKKAILDAGFLVGEGNSRVYSTVKVAVRVDGEIKEAGRRLRMKRDWLDVPGELTWQEKIEMYLEQQKRERHIVAVVPKKKSMPGERSESK